MSDLPIVSIIGRPNVGKSSLFNRILGWKAAVVDDVSGVTRDRNYMQASWGNCYFEIVDTGGLVPTSKENIVAEINAQVDVAIHESSVIIFVVESETGVTDLDLIIARSILKQKCENVILVVNKSETETARREAGTFLSLGLGNPLPISAIHGLGTGDLLERVTRIIKSKNKLVTSPKVIDDSLCIAVIGRPNAGKSSFVNSILKQNRMIVDSVPGTTRDAIDTVFKYKKKTIKLIDTAGLRRKSQVKLNLEYYSNLRALSSMRRTDVCILMIDAKAEMASQDLKILAQLNEMKKGLVVCLNKWDIVEKDHKTFDSMVAEMKKRYMELKYAPFISISALTGQRINNALDLAIKVKEKMESTVKPSKLRELVFNWVKVHPHPFNSSKEVRFLGVRQKKGPYPNFEFFCTNPDSIVPAYVRYLTNKIHESFDFSGCPIVLTFKRGGKSKSKPGMFIQNTEEVN